MAKARNFKSPEAYKKWLAAGHIHGHFARTPGHQKIKIKGKTHKVEHERKAKEGLKRLAGK